jgi:aminopeptidase N
MIKDIRPINYAILIEPDLSEFTFSGEAAIEIQTASFVGEIILNAHELEFRRCLLIHNGTQAECVVSLDVDQQEATVRLPKPISGRFTLHFTYSGLINGRYVGLYRSKYFSNGQEKHLASTQFEAKEARRAFPCFDRPDLKATFDIAFVIPETLTGISNEAILSEQLLPGGKKLVRFVCTPRMSTYLVFFAVGEFEFIEDRSEAPPVRVAVTPGKAPYGHFALGIARQSLHYGAEYTGVPFPLSKCDYIAIPDSMGAMENFGAIRHCEDDLLVHPEKTSKARSVLTAKIIAHETIHQWFGDLVSPASWKFLWLNEALATYFTYLIPDHFFPEWGVCEQFFHERLLPAMDRDSLINTVPIDLPNMDDPDAEPFPTPSTAPIIYNKGAAILRMLAAHLGNSNFKRSIHRFLIEYQFESATSEQFQEVFSNSCGISLKGFFETWINQPGFPIVEVERDGDALTLTQNRFSFDPEPFAVPTWTIPVNLFCFFSDGDVRTVQIVFDRHRQSIPLPDHCTAYKLNADFSGFYRVQYPPENLEKIGELIRNRQISVIDSLNILNDIFALVKAGKYSSGDYLHYLVNYLPEENQPILLVDLAKNLTYLYRVVPEKRADIRQLGRVVFERTLDAIGYLPSDSEVLPTTELRIALLQAAFLFDSPTVSEFGMAQFQALLDGKNVHRDIVSTVMKIGAVVHPDAPEWLRARGCDHRLPEGERISALEALGNLRDEQTLKDALLLNLAEIPVSLRHHMLGEAAFNLSAFDWLWDWYAEHLPIIEAEIPLPYILTITVRLAPLAGMGRRQKVEACLYDFGSRHPASMDSVKMALELLAVNDRCRQLAGEGFTTQEETR